MKIKLLFLVLCFYNATIFAQPNRLLAIDSSRQVSEIDMATGAKTLLGTVDAAAGTTAGLAYDRVNAILYLTSTGNDALYVLNPTTLALTSIGSYGDTAIVMHGLEYHEPTGKLYGMSSHNGGLYDINKTTGVATLVGVTGLTSFCNLAWDSFNNVMYLTSSGSDIFYSINVTTAVATLIGPLTGSTNANGLAFDYNLNRLFMVDNSADNLYLINRTTGLPTIVGSTGSGNLLGLVYVGPTLNTTDFVENTVQVYQQNQQLVIDSQQDAIISLELYDLTGRSLYRNASIQTTHFELESTQFGNQIVVMRIQTERGLTTKKLSIR